MSSNSNESTAAALTMSNGLSRPLNPAEIEALAQLDRLKHFLATAPSRWSSPSQHQAANHHQQHHNLHGHGSSLSPLPTAHPALNRFLLPSGEYVSCVLWSGLYHITGTDIVRALVFRFEAFGRPVVNMKKFEEGVFSDLRNLKPGTDACLEEPKVRYFSLHFLSSFFRRPRALPLPAVGHRKMMIRPRRSFSSTRRRPSFTSSFHSCAASTARYYTPLSLSIYHHLLLHFARTPAIGPSPGHLWRAAPTSHDGQSAAPSLCLVDTTSLPSTLVTNIPPTEADVFAHSHPSLTSSSNTNVSALRRNKKSFTGSPSLMTASSSMPSSEI